MKIRFAAVVAVLFLALGARGALALHVIPAPKSVTPRTGEFVWDRTVYLVTADPGDASQQLAAKLIRDEVRGRMGLDVPVRGKFDPRRGKPVVIGTVGNAALEHPAAEHGISLKDLLIAESYALSVGRDAIVIAGADSDGTFWGAQTLKLMVRGDRRGRALPMLRIDDYPTFRFRGITDDVSRGPVPNMQTVRRNIEQLSELKLNKFNFYIEHTFCYQKHPDIGPKGGCFTAEQLREVAAFAKQYHVELVGGLQSFGHWEHILDKRKYMPLAETPFKPEVLSPAKSGTYELLNDLYSEIVPAFDSQLFNISCDETWGLGSGASRKMVEKMGLEGVYAYHINKIHEMLTARGKRIMMWADIALKHPKIIELLPKDIIFLPWRYGAEESYDYMLKPVVNLGHEFIVAPGVSCWSRIFPDIGNAVENIRQFALDGARFNALGVLNTTWDDDGENLFTYNWYPVAFGAEASWNPFTADPEKFRENFGPVFYDEAQPAAAAFFRSVAGLFTNMEAQGMNDSAFLSWPPFFASPNRKLGELEAKRLQTDAGKTLEEAELLRKAARVNADNADYVVYAAKRIALLARNKTRYAACVRKYERAARPGSEGVDVPATLAEIDKTLADISSDVRATFKTYRKLWMRENRPYYFDVNEKKYDEFQKKIEKSRKTLAAAGESWKKTGTLPPAKDAGL